MNEDFNLVSFGISIAETAIGAFLGFLLGLATIYFQNRQKDASKKQEKIDQANDALKRLLQSSGLNIEAIAMIKLQMLADLKCEMEQMKGYVKEFYRGDNKEKHKIMSVIRSEKPIFYSFYMTFPNISIMEAPEYKEFTRLADDMPALTTFVFRAMGGIHELNSLLDARNMLISDHSKENAAGMSDDRFIYFASMLSDTSEAIIQTADNTISFFLLIKRQVESFLRYRSNVKGFVSYNFISNVEGAIPDRDLFPILTAQLVEFENQQKVGLSH